MTFELHIEQTLQKLLQQEDTDGDKRITIEDSGPKKFDLIATNGEKYSLLGTYHLSNLLQELILAKETNREKAMIPLSKLNELPVSRISRMIKDYFWDGLTRTMDSKGIEALLSDSKNDTIEGAILKVYVPFTDQLAFSYYTRLKEKLPLEVIQLPENVTPEYVRSLNDKSGILSLKLSEKNGEIAGEPFVVPGGRFNEMYGWDSYFEAIGLLIDHREDLAIGMANNFKYEIEHYGKILNANRSYYLTRTQPPFYTSLISEIFDQTKNLSWLQSHLEAAISEYETVWMVEGKRLTKNGLNRYLAEGIGRPPEAEAGHFTPAFSPFAAAASTAVEDYENLYAEGKIKNEELDQYFVHDRSVRESGHDTSYRLEGTCAHLNAVELNAFLYKYESDFSELINSYFNNSFIVNGKEYSSAYWNLKMEERKQQMDAHLWNEEYGLYFDYNCVTKKQVIFISATTFTPLWAKACSKQQAKKIVENAIPRLKELGGIASCDQESRGTISEKRPQKQWDYPNGWAPHQMMIWKGLLNYGYVQEMQELAYRWLYMITKNAVDYNGTIPEKYDVVSATHKVFAEYGNVGTEFQYITKEGFGWMNASFQYGVSLLKKELITHLNKLTPPNELFK